MDDLNYQHLRYFWVTAREGSLSRAAERLGLAPSTVSAQIKSLEEQLDTALFRRKGRSLELTEAGRAVGAYADEIFALGRELRDVVRSPTGARHARRLRVGIAQSLPKLVVYGLLEPALKVPGVPVHLVCVEDAAEALVADLVVQHLDLVLTDAQVGLASDLRTDSVLLGTTSVSWMASAPLAARLRPGFPNSLDDAPVLLPDSRSSMRRLLEDWFGQNELHPRVLAEMDDSALLKSFGQGGVGAFPVPTCAVLAVQQQYRVELVGELPDVEERFFAVAAPGHATNPVIRAVLAHAPSVLLGRDAA